MTTQVLREIDPEDVARAIHAKRCEGAQSCVDFDMLDGCEDAAYLDELRRDAQAATDAIMALVQPVVTDETRAMTADEERTVTDALRASTRPIAHAVTRDDVIEELERDIYELGIVGMRVEHQTLVAHWLRSRKGGA